jgi:hypothetical protein
LLTVAVFVPSVMVREWRLSFEGKLPLTKNESLRSDPRPLPPARSYR